MQQALVNEMDVAHVGGRIMVPKYVYVLIPEILNMLPYRDFAGVVKLKMLRWRVYSGLFGVPSVTTRVLRRGRQDQSARDVRMEAVRQRFEDTILLALKIEEEVMSQGMHAAFRLEKARTHILR